VYDWYHPSRIVIGSADEVAAARTAGLYESIEAPLVFTSLTSAETIKYASNAYLVTRISFINEISRLCDAVGADIDDVAGGIGSDPRIGPHFLKAGLGYGGSCFPKDVRSLDFHALNHGCDLRLIKAAIEVNNRQRITAVHKIKTMLNDLEDRTITLLGTAFKPGTDDVRESPVFGIADRLSEAGAHLQICDPLAADNARPYLPQDCLVTDDLFRAVTGAHGVILITEWPEFIEADWSIIKNTMQTPWAIVDGRNCLNQAKLVSLGFTYTGMGRQPQHPAKVAVGI
jgi:UDPglucose 6-dehydrogenase